MLVDKCVKTADKMNSILGELEYAQSVLGGNIDKTHYPMSPLMTTKTTILALRQKYDVR